MAKFPIDMLPEAPYYYRGRRHGFVLGVLFSTAVVLLLLLLKSP